MDSLIDQALHSFAERYVTLSPTCAVAFREVAEPMSVPKGTLLVTEGQYSNHMYFLLSGTIREYYVKDGKDITDWFAIEHEFTCAINSYFLKVPSEHYVETLQPCELILVKRKALAQLCAEFHEFETLSRMAITRIMLHLQRRIVSIQFETAAQRYVNLLKVLPDITQRAPLGHIASFLGITQETLSRIRASHK
ncbi:cyclic nucleotide-binding domain-containing protein [Chitinophaga sp. SYP-B3965]|uniref:Crp/Fnr family transcriptional regulator n=1 Tax=Chitinophaga sp. SYP-B3965 TaxID=2663120 RepID=UPI001299C82A|nr:Crp/Fnr family transcriptional regulator [Chitinophaga sp. SYP-B3965]MRG43769.1 cyclic nucleotide-binding domain-containing protein [Chitinophaga sp. SYP-B3965]